MKKPPELTPAEVRLVAAYRAGDRIAKQDTLLWAEVLAREHPARLDRPKLRLIKGSYDGAGRTN